MKYLTALAAALSSLPALAHEGHGLFGSHWHATDALGFMVMAGLIAVAVWMSKR